MNLLYLLDKKQSLLLPNSSKKLAKIRAQTIKKQAIVTDDITPEHTGRLKHGTTYWFGLAIDPTQTFLAGTLVEVCYREGNTLFVQAVPKALPMGILH